MPVLFTAELYFLLQQVVGRYYEIMKISYSLTCTPQILHLLVSFAGISLYYNGCKMPVFLILSFLTYFLKTFYWKKHPTYCFAYLLSARTAGFLFYLVRYSPLLLFSLMLTSSESGLQESPSAAPVPFWTSSCQFGEQFFPFGTRCSSFTWYVLFPQAWNQPFL